MDILEGMNVDIRGHELAVNGWRNVHGNGRPLNAI